MVTLSWMKRLWSVNSSQLPEKGMYREYWRKGSFKSQLLTSLTWRNVPLGGQTWKKTEIRVVQIDSGVVMDSTTANNSEAVLDSGAVINSDAIMDNWVNSERHCVQSNC